MSTRRLCVTSPRERPGGGLEGGGAEGGRGRGNGGGSGEAHVTLMTR